MVLLEILLKIQSAIQFVFALNLAHEMSVKTQKIQLFLSPCVSSFTDDGLN